MDMNKVIFSLEDYVDALSKGSKINPSQYILNSDDYLDIEQAEKIGWILSSESVRELMNFDMYSLEARVMNQVDAKKAKQVIIKAAKDIYKVVMKNHNDVLVPRILNRAVKYNRGTPLPELKKAIQQAFSFESESQFVKKMEDLLFKNATREGMKNGVRILTLDPRSLSEYNGENVLKAAVITLYKTFLSGWAIAINRAINALFEGSRSEGIHKFGQVLKVLNIVPLISRKGSIYNYKEHMGWQGTMHNKNQWFRFAWMRDGAFVLREATHASLWDSDYQLMVIPRFYFRDVH